MSNELTTIEATQLSTVNGGTAMPNVQALIDGAMAKVKERIGAIEGRVRSQVAEGMKRAGSLGVSANVVGKSAYASASNAFHSAKAGSPGLAAK